MFHLFKIKLQLLFLKKESYSSNKNNLAAPKHLKSFSRNLTLAIHKSEKSIQYIIWRGAPWWERSTDNKPFIKCGYFDWTSFQSFSVSCLIYSKASCSLAAFFTKGSFLATLHSLPFLKPICLMAMCSSKLQVKEKVVLQNLHLKFNQVIRSSACRNKLVRHGIIWSAKTRHLNS